MLFYRFRKISNLLDNKELENQSIYFAPPEDLNDPMEGFRNIVWQGDKITWENLFKHYLLCCEHMYNLFIIFGEKNISFDEKMIPIYKRDGDFPNEEHRLLFKKIEADLKIKIQQLIGKVNSKIKEIGVIVFSKGERNERVNY